MSGKSPIDEKLATVVYHIDKEPHIIVKKELCAGCEKKPCLICPAECYQRGEEEALTFNHEGCLECGTCRLVCPRGAVDWSYPKKGSGVSYRFG